MHNEREVKRRAQSGWHATNPALITNVVKKPERNWAALSAAALKPAIGYWEDAPRGMKFGSVAQSAEHRPIHDKPNGPCKPEVAGSMPAAPTPPQSADEELYEPVGTMPVVGDKVIVLEADGTPYNGDDAGKPQEVLSVHGRECVTGYCELKMEYFCAPHPLCKIQNRILKRTQANKSMGL